MCIRDSGDDAAGEVSLEDEERDEVKRILDEITPETPKP